MKIIIAGDFCPRYRTETLVEEGKYADILGEIKNIIEDADYSIINLECPVVESPLAKPIQKCGPNLRCSSKAIEAIQYTGFKAVTLANNHILDYGAEGLHNTIEVCKKAGLDIVGVGKNLKDSRKILYKNISGKNVAFINCCENEFSVAQNSEPGANPLDSIQQFHSIQEARRNADYVITIIHGGHEHYQLPSPRMKELYRYFIDCGADAVINHHQHCYSGHELYKEKNIFYGLGNLCFDNEKKHNGIWTEGYMVELNIKNSIDFRIIPYTQCASLPKVELMHGEDLALFNAKVQTLNTTIQDDMLLEKSFKSFAMEQRKDMISRLQPYSKHNRLANSLFYHDIIPFLLPVEKRLSLLNSINCEAHKDILLEILKIETKQ